MAATANSWFPERGKWKIEWLPAKASTALSANVLVDLTAGFIVEASTNTGQTDQPLIGIHIGAARTSGDSTTPLVPVLVPGEPGAVARGLIDTGTPSATADIGKSFDISATGGVTFSTSSNEPVTFWKYISATQGLFVLTSYSAPAA